jgi:hypothetical protein
MPIPPVPPQTSRAANALQVFNSLIATPAGIAEYKARAGHRAAFDAERARLGVPATVTYDHIPAATRRLLERISQPELALLAELDATYVTDGLYVDVPAAGRAYFK